jgi:hypothetical protein
MWCRFLETAHELGGDAERPRRSFVQFLDRPGRREAAIGHCIYVKQKLREASCAELSWRLSTCGMF